MKQKSKLRNLKRGITSPWPKGVPKPKPVDSSELGKFSNPQMQELYDVLGEAMFMRFCTLNVEIHVRCAHVPWPKPYQDPAPLLYELLTAKNTCEV